MLEKNLHVVVGLGLTGLSCVNFLVKKNIPVALTDSRNNPPFLAELKKNHPHIPVSLGKLDEAMLAKAAKIILSPGISLATPEIAHQRARGIPVVGDIELFAEEVNAPAIVITGTNAKSTVTTLVGEMAAAAKLRVQVGGNLGTPALDLLAAPDTELFVLELSSFQLETTDSLAPVVATILNITPDHMDRYATFAEYCAAKQRIYTHCKVAVCNLDDPQTECKNPDVQKIYFTLQNTAKKSIWISEKRARIIFGL